MQPFYSDKEDEEQEQGDLPQSAVRGKVVGVERAPGAGDRDTLGEKFVLVVKLSPKFNVSGGADIGTARVAVHRVENLPKLSYWFRPKKALRNAVVGREIEGALDTYEDGASNGIFWPSADDYPSDGERQYHRPAGKWKLKLKNG